MKRTKAPKKSPKLRKAVRRRGQLKQAERQDLNQEIDDRLDKLSERYELHKMHPHVLRITIGAKVSFTKDYVPAVLEQALKQVSEQLLYAYKQASEPELYSGLPFSISFGVKESFLLAPGDKDDFSQYRGISEFDTKKSFDKVVEEAAGSLRAALPDIMADMDATRQYAGQLLAKWAWPDAEEQRQAQNNPPDTSSPII